MAKKKATMTLKDFHGGSIPSDLPLPSAPGVLVRQPDRNNFDRPASWGNPMGRSDHRLRPGSAGAVRNFEDRTPYFSNRAHIGRNFDEDERKPLDGVSAPRRTVSDENIQTLPGHVELKVDYSSTSRTASRPSSTPGSQYSRGLGNGTYAARFTEANNVGVSSQSSGGNNIVSGISGQVASGSLPNAWGLRKEPAVKEVVSLDLPAPDAASKFAHASALEKVSSGRWHSKQQFTSRVDIEVVSHPEPERGSQYNGAVVYPKDAYNTTNVVGSMGYQDASLARHAERSLTIDDRAYGSVKAFPAYERARSPTYLEPKEKNHSSSIQSSCIAGTLGNHESQPSILSQTTERPKLKLLPRSKPLENVEPSVDYKQDSKQPNEPLHADNGNVSHVAAKDGYIVYDGADQGVERPNVHLKSQFQSLKKVEATSESDRKGVFGGARPRGTVLKDRGVNDTAVNNFDIVQPPYWSKQEALKSESAPQHAAVTRYVNRVENVPVDRSRTAKSFDKRDHRTDVARADMQRKNWRNENRRNHREIEKFQQQSVSQERLPSPETWRKPVEQPKPASSDAPGPRYGKVASAMELAQAFSKSASGPLMDDRFSGQRSALNRGQMPFSRLMEPSPRPQISGRAM